MTSLDPVAAMRLLQYWGPTRPGTDLPAYRCVPVSGQAPPPTERLWDVPPSPAEVTRYGGFPETSTEDGPSGHRYPVAVETVNHTIVVPERLGHSWTSARPAEEVAEEIERLLTGALAPGPSGPCALAPGPDAGAPDEQARELIAVLAAELAGGHRDLLRVGVAAEPGGAPLDDELHLLVRSHLGDTLRLSITAAPSAAFLGGSYAGADRRAEPAGRAECAAELLGEFVWLSNNERMRVEVRIVPHGLGLDPADPDDAVRAWWRKSDHWARLVDDEWWEEDEQLRPLDEETLTEFLAAFQEHNVSMAGSGAWAMGEIDDYDIDDDSQPRFPGDRLVALLGRDVFDATAAQVAGAPGDGRPAAYGIGLPFEISDEDYGFHGCLLLVGPERTGIITIDAMA
ncbi:hypothetical protein [Embleya sp. AB8]|uniref:hypothetical protein n=1 Tax=Embleya sp. AB8 TaxID=3156304 RepID=UPI003C77556A